jgi:hypothetical protein
MLHRLLSTYVEYIGQPLLSVKHTSQLSEAAVLKYMMLFLLSKVTQSGLKKL